MRLKRIMLITFVLLAILTIGTVSASDDIDLNETLTASDVQETIDVSCDDDVLGEMNPEDVNIEVRNIDGEDSGATFVDVFLTEKDGNFVICKGEGEETQEIYREDISSCDKVDKDEVYHLGVSLDDVNDFISENINNETNFYDIVAPGDVLRFVLEYQDEDFAKREYRVDFDENNILFNDAGGIDGFLWDSDNDGPLYVDFEEKVMDISLPEDTKGTIVVQVEDDEFKWEVDSNYHEWTLNDLGITEVGNYSIVVKYIDEEDSAEIIRETTFNVVEFNNDAFRATVNFDEKKVKFFCPDSSEGTITITVERYDEGQDDFVIIDDYGYGISSDYQGQWSEIPFDEFEVPVNTDLRIRFEVSDDQYSYEKYGHVRGSVEIYTDNVADNGIVYSDNGGYILEVSPREGFDSGRVEIIVNGVSRFNAKLYFPADYYGYFWCLRTLNMTEPGEYDVTVKITTEEGEEFSDFRFNVVEFKNDTFRAKTGSYIEDDEGSDVLFFCPDGASGIITLTVMQWIEEEEDEVPVGEYTYEINSTMYNKWTVLHVLQGDDYNAHIKVDDSEIPMERNEVQNIDNFDFEINDWGNLYEDEVVARIFVPFNQTDSNITFNIYSSEKELASIKLSELQGRDYEWRTTFLSLGYYVYDLTLEDVNSFATLSDKDAVLFNLSVKRSIGADGVPYRLYHIQKDDGLMRLYSYEALRIDLVEISLAEYGSEEDEPALFNVSQDVALIKMGVPDELNITQTAVVRIEYADNAYTKNMKDMDCEYQYNYLGNVFNILLSDLSPENLKDRDVINITLLNGDDVIGYKTIIVSVNEDGLLAFYDFEESINLDFHFGEIGHSEFGVGNSDGNLMILSIPDYLNVTEGAVQLIADDGTVLFSKSLAEFEENLTSHDGVQIREFKILDSLDEFDYSCIPEGVNFTAAFTYGNTTLSFSKGVRKGNELYHISTPADVSKLFKVTVSEGILCDGEANAIIIEATDDANRQSIVIDIGGGYFAVYVNGKKVEDLGRLVRVNNETELELFRLCSNYQGTSKLYIYLPDINVTENGEYNIRVTYVSQEWDFHEDVETELFNKNITLTSNVKVNYQNGTTRLFTGYGFDPVLMYLDTYYDDISTTNGTITVFNSKGTQILSKSIRELNYDNGRYYLSYSDFENKDFGDNITVKYSNGNERDGETTLDVLWKDVESDDFAPTVNSDVDDYYGDFINMDIPDALNDGQIIVTIKFKNNHGSTISNMNVTTDFDSQAVYRFNVADIKASTENGDLNLALSDLGFYETNGAYDIDVKFTADGNDILDVVNSSIDVKFSEEILISINDTSRYTMELPFASARVFEPISAYGELYIDGVLYSHKIFEKGLITFYSSPQWAVGNHTAELRVCDSEFGTVLNSSETSFETLAQSGDVEVSIDSAVKENENAIVEIDVPKDGDVFIQIDNGEKVKYTLKKGSNTVDLGILAYGNHTIYVSYNTTLEDGSVSFYNNYLSLFVGDDGHWLNLPEPLVLDNDDTVKMNFGSDAKGNVSLTIDGVEVANMELVNGSAELTLTDYFTGVDKYGEHTYNITYSGDDTHDGLSKAGVFNVTYLFKDNLIKEGFPLREYYTIIITLPGDAKGTVQLVTENKKLSSQVSNGQAAFEVDGLDIGEHDITVSYSGDDKYPATSYSNILNVSYYAVVGILGEGKRIVSLTLPANATGNLIVYNDNTASQLCSVPVVNGKASADLSQVSVGKYELRAVYDGSDYDVRSFATEFDVLPEIYISQDIVIGQTGQIFVDLDNSTGHLLVLVEGISPKLLEITDGKINYTFDTEGMSKGNHTVNFQYFGNSFDGNIFYAVNKDTGYPMPINYNMHLLPKDPSVNMTSGDDWIIVDCGNATGTIELYVNGVKEGVFNIVNGIAMIDMSNFRDGNYNLTFKYSGDSIYDGFTRELNMDVVHKVPTITAKNTNVLYTAKGKYSVTVRDEEGNLVSGTKVSFVIGGKVYGTAKTNSKGVASIVIGKNPGTYKITAKALGVNVTKTLTVKHLVTLKKVTVKRSAKSLVLTATLSKVNKKYLKNKKITFKFNGKKYTAKTNKKGVAKVTIKSTVLKKLKVGKKVTYQATYIKDTVKKSIKVKK
ncbi:Ig-like domain repeat protein [uncultured Methanobrevibacter sp.]|uniref:Ig-like domain repeat protein n=1 Tax=uncultured Methanobrevibacter sp. TaxID=253161 RepID=UPI0026274A83|nr:Ig-like domain repeat protein [uncultured Methanobrevibacter sp.]